MVRNNQPPSGPALKSFSTIAHLLAPPHAAPRMGIIETLQPLAEISEVLALYDGAEAAGGTAATTSAALSSLLCRWQSRWPSHGTGSGADALLGILNVRRRLLDALGQAARHRHQGSGPDAQQGWPKDLWRDVQRAQAQLSLAASHVATAGEVHRQAEELGCCSQAGETYHVAVVAAIDVRYIQGRLCHKNALSCHKALTQLCCHPACCSFKVGLHA